MGFSLELRNYRCFREVDWQPKEVSVIVGPNGAGKTTLLSSFDLLRNVYLRSLSSALYFNGGSWGIKNLMAPQDEHVTIKVTLDGLSWEITPGIESMAANGEFGELVMSADKGQLIRRELYSDKFAFEGQDLTANDISAIRKAYETTHSVKLEPIVNAITNFRVYSDYRLYQLRQHGSRNEGDLYLSRGGENLFSVLRNWRDKRANRESYDLVRIGMRTAFPDFFDDWEFEISSQNVSLQFLIKNIENEIPLSLMPDGLLVALLHLTAIAGAVPGTLICIDEMENALHPFAIRSLTESIRRIAKQRDLTVVLSTHSPVLLDQFKQDPSKVFVLSSEIGREVASLDELRDPDWLAHFSIGELYSDAEFGSRQSHSFDKSK